MTDRLLDLHALSLWTTFTLFFFAAAIVWVAAMRLTSYAGALSRKTGLGQGFVGMVFLALATSLPEVGTTTTASLTGSAPLAANNLLGGVALQTAVLAVADATTRGALTATGRRRPLLVQAASVVLILSVALTGIAIGGGPQVFGAGIWTLAGAAIYLASALLVRRTRRPPEQPLVEPGAPRSDEDTLGNAMEASASMSKSTVALAIRFAAGGLVILLGGSVLASSADAIAANTALGGGFVGGTLLAVATSLPELSSTIQACRLGMTAMAISNVLGGNAIDAFLLAPADVLYPRGPILGQVGQDSAFLAGVGIVLTLVYVVGLLRPGQRTVWWVGVDSAVVAVLYAASIVLLYVVR